MNDSDRQQLKTRLIKAGFWAETETGDPTADTNAALTIQARIFGEFGARWFLGSGGQVGMASSRKITVTDGEFRYVLADGDNYPEAICLAALTLSEFLIKHPECAA